MGRMKRIEARARLLGQPTTVWLLVVDDAYVEVYATEDGAKSTRRDLTWDLKITHMRRAYQVAEHNGITYTLTEEEVRP